MGEIYFCVVCGRPKNTSPLTKKGKRGFCSSEHKGHYGGNCKSCKWCYKLYKLYQPYIIILNHSKICRCMECNFISINTRHELMKNYFKN